MLDLNLKYANDIDKVLKKVELTDVSSLEEKVKLLIIRDLIRLGWRVTFNNSWVLITPPEKYDRNVIKNSMSVKRHEIIKNNSLWIKNNIEYAKQNLATGSQVVKSRIEPLIEICRTKKQHNLFRILRYYWSSPYSEYVGRRIRLIIRDKSITNLPVIGIAALGSSIIHIPERDQWLGWDKKTRTNNIIYTMDAYIIGSLPPYNDLLGGKLISYILASNEIRAIFHEKYKNRLTTNQGRLASELACIFTTSLYGKSSQYNRIRYNGRLLYIPIGETKGYGTLHLTQETIIAIQEFLRSKKIFISNKFGDGPSWTMRIIRTAGDILGFDSEKLLRHSFKRHIYAIPLAANFKEFLNGEDNKLNYFDFPMEDLVSYWRQRWLCNRKKNEKIINKVLEFNPEQFNI